MPKSWSRKRPAKDMSSAAGRGLPAGRSTGPGDWLIFPPSRGLASDHSLSVADYSTRKNVPVPHAVRERLLEGGRVRLVQVLPPTSADHLLSPDECHLVALGQDWRRLGDRPGAAAPTACGGPETRHTDYGVGRPQRVSALRISRGIACPRTNAPRHRRARDRSRSRISSAKQVHPSQHHAKNEPVNNPLHKPVEHK